jgi:hypothetical protein
MRTGFALFIASIAGIASATLPPASDEAKARAAETAAKGAWSDKVALYQLCVSMDRTADAYRRGLKAEAKPIPSPVATPSCSDPGPYVSQAQVTPTQSKPLEASGAQSPPGTALSPPSTKSTTAEVAGATKRP